MCWTDFRRHLVLEEWGKGGRSHRCCLQGHLYSSQGTLSPFPLPQAWASRDQACLLSPDAEQPLIPLVEPDSVWLSRSFWISLPLSPPRCFDFAPASLFLCAHSLGCEQRCLLAGGSCGSCGARQELPVGHGSSLPGSPERSERAPLPVTQASGCCPLPGELVIHTEVSPFLLFQVFLCRAG